MRLETLWKTTVAPGAGLAAILALTAAGWAQEPSYPRRAYETRPADAPPKLDGRLDDACWASVPWGGEFLQWEPAEGQPPSQQTAFKIVYTLHDLFIAYRAYDTDPTKISSLLARRDRFPGDWVEINIDSYFDHRTAYSFTSSVSGVRGDEFVSNDGENWDSNWDPIWELATQVDSLGWTAEVRIPLSQLRFADKEDQVWGIQVQRRIFRQEERSLWQPKSKQESGWVSRFGELRGIHGVRAQRQVELLPYSVARGETFEKIPGNELADGKDGDLQFGLDGKIGVNSNMTVDFTVNPDFGQVEADPSEVNLTAFETRFDEKRPFFIEGNSILDFQLAPSIAGGSFTADNLFYSRRIGRGLRIVGASKLTGRTEHGLSIGGLESVTAKNNAPFQSSTGANDNVEPLTNFFVGRVQQDLYQGDLHFGAMATAVNRRLEGVGSGLFHTAAYSGGVDLLRQWHDKEWYVAGTGSLSRVEGSPEALLETQTRSSRYFQRPDNDYESVDSTRTELNGFASSFRFGRAGGDWRFETGATCRSPGFEINDVGFMRRADEINQFTWVGWAERNPFAIFRRLGINGNQWLDWDFGGTLLTKRVNANFNANFKNNWACGSGVNRTFESISNNALRGGPSSRWPGTWDGWFWVDTDTRPKISGSFGANWYDGDEGIGHMRNGWVDLTYRPNNALKFTLSPSYTKNLDELQYVDSPGSPTRYVFGRLDQETAAVTLRLDYTIRPNLTVQFYGEPFVSAGSYTAFKRVESPLASQLEDRFHGYSTDEIRYDEAGNTYQVDETGDGIAEYDFSNPNFDFRDFNSNLVTRWEFQPGSVLFLVWSQSRTDFVQTPFELGQDIHALFDVHSHDVFLFKISKWFSL